MTPEIETLTTISPTTNTPILTRHGPSSADLALLPSLATAAFDSYRLTPLSERQAIVRRALDLLDARQDALAKELTEQIGRPIAAAATEISTAVKRAAYLLKISGEVLEDTEGEREEGFRRFVRKVPVGPVLVIFAWNVRFPSMGGVLRLWLCSVGLLIDVY